MGRAGHLPASMSKRKRQYQGYPLSVTFTSTSKQSRRKATHMARFNFRIGWFRIELLPKFRIVYDVRRNVSGGTGGLVVVAIGALTALG